MEEIKRVKMVATDGMILTNGKSYGRVVYLAMDDSPDNWHEISLAEYEAMAGGEPATDEDYQAALREMGVKV